MCSVMVDTYTRSYTVEAVHKSQSQPFSITLYTQRHAVGFCERLCDDPNTQESFSVDVRRLHWVTRTTCHRVIAVDGRSVIVDVFTFSAEADTQLVRSFTVQPHTEPCGGGGARMLASHELVSTGSRRGAAGAGRDGNVCSDLDTPLIPPCTADS